MGNARRDVWVMGAPGTVGNLSRGASGNLGHTFGGVSVILDAASLESE